ncbi:rhodanese-like domain-containing protein [Deinococcus pimensis]|uniref:rhodanese-like domain-containing protein n=1 Tax=Deinococcus pimensis TaxID=309888 RepID=UPI0005EB9EB7|nr:rhodanese-like domain-containing protein [Deinococcus pimensis]
MKGSPLSVCLVTLGTLTVAWAPVTPTVFDTTLGEQDVRTAEVSTAELRVILTDGRTLVLDARPHQEWATSHIPGALNVAPKPGVSAGAYVSDVREIERLTNGDHSRALVLYCNGPFCGKSKRLSEELLAAGFTNVRRYQLGAPVWRALGGEMVIEPEGARYVAQNDRTAWWVDARPAGAFGAGSLPGARNVPEGEVGKAKDDGRLPMLDHNTRVIVFGEDAAQARRVADELLRNAFHNVTFYDSSYQALRAVLNSPIVER